MQIFTNIEPLQAVLANFRRKNQSIAFVPTMGGLHLGHLSLIDAAKQNADKVIVSIFVNPTQFGENEDFNQYPNTLKIDIELLKQHQVDVLFNPDKRQIYPKNHNSAVKIGNVSSILCGISRPTHFQGMAQVVNRFFNIINPNCAIFGQKDYQQLMIIRQMVKDLSMDISIISAPIVREPCGLAMSTRNQYLSTDERVVATNLYKILLEMKTQLLLNTNLKTLNRIVSKQLNYFFKLDYLEVLDADTFKQITNNTDKIAILSAVFIGQTRLIDNIIFKKG